MNHTIRLLTAVLLLAAAACAHKEQPPVTKSGKTVVPVVKR